MAITESFLDSCPDSNKLLKILGDVKVSESAILIVLSFYCHVDLQLVTEMAFFYCRNVNSHLGDGKATVYGWGWGFGVFLAG
jgi:hypothetical protein